MRRPCGCPRWKKGHATPHVDPVLGVRHGERNPYDPDDPPPFWDEESNSYCLCGHPNYLTCPRWRDGSTLGLTIRRRTD